MLTKRIKRKDKTISSTVVVITSFLVDILDIVLSLAVAILSGSVIMLAQVLEGVADLVSSGLLLVGIARAGQKPDRAHPFGFGRELYVWALLSGIVMIGISATLSILFGWQRFLYPQQINDLHLAFIVLAFTTLTNSFAFYLSLKRLLRGRSLNQVVNIFLHSSLIETKTTFILDLMGTAASILGIMALMIYKITGDFRYDGFGAILIGATLAILAFVLLMGVVDLIVGRSASMEVEDKIRLAALQVPKVNKILGLRTLHIGSEKLLVNMEVNLESRLTTRQIENLVDKIKEKIRRAVPQAKHVQVELEGL